MKKDIENKLLAVIRVRGTVGVRQSITETLTRLNLKRVNNLTIIYGSKSNLGMIDKCNDFIAYGEISQEILNGLLESKDIKLSTEDMAALANGKKNFKVLVGGALHMHPPRRGYASTKKGYSTGGALGYRGQEIDKLIKRMM